MTRRDATGADGAAGDAADWFVRVDAAKPGANDALAAWLAARPENERAFERVELAFTLGKRLAAEPRSALHAEAVRLAVRVSRRQPARRALVFGGAVLAAASLAAIVVLRVARAPSTPVEHEAPLRAAQLVAVDAPNNPISVLPTGVVVDASAVAVLPFAATDDPTLAEGIERDIVAALRSVPGLYVIAEAAVTSYAGTELAPLEIGTQLGARGIVDAGVDLADGRVRIEVRLRDAATGVTLWRADVDRPVDELRALRYEIADNIAATMLDPSLRDRLERADASRSTSFAKPIGQ
jgi:TolB-like protein